MGEALSRILAVIAVLGASACDVRPTQDASDRTTPDGYFEAIKDKPPFLRLFLNDFPKGADLHNHLAGAVYAESYLEWAAEDGLCADMSGPALLPPNPASTPSRPCEGGSLMPAANVLGNDDLRRQMIDSLSTRSFVPFAGWSGHDQFFATFFKMATKPERMADMITRTANRAGRQNEVYLELMVTTEFPRIMAFTAALPWPDIGENGIEAAYKALQDAGLETELAALVGSSRAALDAADTHRDQTLMCGTLSAQPGCDVEVRYLYQVIRSMPRNFVFVQSILGFALTQEDPRVVGLNFVAPEDGRVALVDYRLHMKMLKFLAKTMGPIDITLHAGELTLGLVRPDHLRFHIRDAIETGGATRIGHGIDISYEENAPQLLRHMAENGIMVEINLTSNDDILGVSGDDHPINLYRAAGVPVALSTDDEGVSRHDLTHEYQRAVETYGFTYDEMKELSRNGLRYNFLPGDSMWLNLGPVSDCAMDMLGGDTPSATCSAFLSASEKARLEWELERRFLEFEQNIDRWPQP